MASEQPPAPARPSRRAPRGVADLPVRDKPTANAAPAPTDLAGFKPKRRASGESRHSPHSEPERRSPTRPEIENAERAGSETGAPSQFRRVGHPSRAASPPLPAGEGRGEGERIANPPSGQRRSAPVRTRRLIVNADDFGRSHSINQAVIRAHREGILTTASLMVNGDACAEAVELARQNPALGVGLHLTLVCGKAACGRMEIPDLVNPLGEFSHSPVAAGMRYFFDRGLRLQLAREIAAQFAKFKATGLPLDHVNGHLNLHLHPTIFELLASRHLEWDIRRLRVTDDPYALNRRLARGQWFYRASHAFIFRRLSARARRILSRSDIRFTDHVFGLLQNARVDERYVTRLLPELPCGDSELYSHPSLDEFRHEFDALISPRVKALVAEQGIELIRYQDL